MQIQWKNIFWLFIAGVAVLMPVLSFDYGITWDEWVQNEYGKELLKYFSSFGKEKQNVLPGGLIVNATDLYLYGGLFDLITACANKFSPFGEYETRHFVNSLFGVMTILFTGLLAKELKDWRAAILASLLLFISPGFFGHSMNNPKDIPFALAYVFTILFMIRFIKNIDAPKKRDIIFLIIGIAVCINIRVGGILLIAYLLLFSLVTIGLKPWLDKRKKGDRIKFKSSIPVLKRLIWISLLGYFCGLIFWPYGHRSPLINPFNALSELSRYNEVANFTILFEGKSIMSSEIPWYYIPKWIMISTPLAVVTGFVIFFFLLKRFFKNKNQFAVLMMILFVIIFPWVYATIQGSVLYDAWRHFIFIYPPMVVIATLYWIELFDTRKMKIFKYITMLALILLTLHPAKWLFESHPHQYVYFNELGGGIETAYQKYDTDYWGNSLRMAAEWLAENHDYSRGPLNILVDASQMCVGYYVYKKIGPSFYIVATDQNQHNYSILLIRNKINSPHYNNIWPPAGTIHEVKVKGITLAAVVKNFSKL